jgi:glycosyltransferase involved in cell wall biosynthesis
MTPDISIAFYSRNRSHLLQAALETIPPEINYPITIISDASSDNRPYRKLVGDRQDIHLIEQPKKSGFAYLLNNCIINTTTRYVLVSGDDFYYHPNLWAQIDQDIADGYDLALYHHFALYLVDKTMIPRVNGWWDESLRNYVDVDYSIRMNCDEVKRVCHLSKNLCNHRSATEPAETAAIRRNPENIVAWDGPQVVRTLDEKYNIKNLMGIFPGIPRGTQPATPDPDWHPRESEIIQELWRKTK